MLESVLSLREIKQDILIVGLHRSNAFLFSSILSVPGGGSENGMTLLAGRSGIGLAGCFCVSEGGSGGFVFSVISSP
jgi:hypothetical protein